jgi:hypothetical protein
LKGKVPYEVWYGCKPDISHIRVFGSYGWAHVAKEVCKGKLDSQAVRVRMLGWWADESKGYCLEDLENRKLIASQDVQFDEDNSPSNVASIDISLPHSTGQEIIDLTMLDEQPSPRKIVISQPPTPATPSTGGTPDERPTTPEISPKSPPSTPKKSSKWQDLPKRESSTHERHQTKQYGFNDNDKPLDSHVAFIATTGPSYSEAIASADAKGWQEAVDKEYDQLARKGVFEEIDELPNGKKAVGSKVVLQEKVDEHGNHVKFKA